MIKDIGIPRIVIGCKDSNPKVTGKGISILSSSGAEVVTGVLEKECRCLNRRFFTFHEKRRPYVILKWAESADGYIDMDRQKTGNNHPIWITNHTAKMLVHKWRSEELSIMTGTNTLILDNPELTVREWPGINPIRIGMDKNGRLFEGIHIKDGQVPSIIFSETAENDSENLSYISLPAEGFEIERFLEEMYERQVLSTFVEGGAKLIQGFINSGLWDESFVFYGNKMFHSGVKAPVLDSAPYEKKLFRGTKLFIYRNKP